MADKGFKATVSPHLHEKGQTIERGMRNVLIALCPVVIFALIVYGMNTIYIILTSMITACLTEAIISWIRKRPVSIKDLSALVTGLLFALILPPTTPLWVVAIGAFIAIAVGKELFGGLGKNIFNPALFARIALMISPLALYTQKYVEPFFWKNVGFFTPVATTINDSVAGRVVYKTMAGNAVNAVTSATPLSLLKSGKMLTDTVTGPTPVGATWLTSSGKPSLWSLFIGTKGGCLGEISVLLLLIGGLYLIWKKTIDWRIPVGIIGAFFFVMLVTWNHPVYQLLSGGLFLGAFFMATDWVTSPMSKRGKWIYGIGIGVFVAFIRLYSPWPEGVAISILFWNVLTLLIDRYIAVPKFGEAKRPWFNKLPVYPKPKPTPAQEKTS
ncbi:MAG: RnfABCDGE type electron transport complex subunit D [Actinomycetota bacterium]|nr:RnfABCDGE type electron transport complex subunit D [Actinomycetota bacterium]